MFVVTVFIHHCITGLVVNYGISNTYVLEIPQFTTKAVICMTYDNEDDAYIRYGPIITWSVFSQILTLDTHSSPSQVSYGVSESKYD